MMDNQEIRAALNEYWEATAALDLDRVDEFYHNDVIIKYPQSGEQIRGKRSLRELRALTPTKVAFKILRTRGEGNLWVTELVIIYGGRPVNVVSIMVFREGKVAHQTYYFGDPFEPPKWRSQWVEKRH